MILSMFWACLALLSCLIEMREELGAVMGPCAYEIGHWKLEGGNWDILLFLFLLCDILLPLFDTHLPQ